MPNDIDIKKVFNKKKILSQAESMIKEKRESNNGTGPLLMFKEHYQNKYSYLYKNFPMLFDMIFEDPDNHDCLEMTKKMLACADMYHNQHVSHENSSKMAGKILFDKFYTEPKKNLKK